MAAAAQSSTSRQLGNNHLRLSAGLHISLVIRKTDDGVGVRNIDKLRIRTQRIKGDAERLCETGGEDFALFCFAILTDAAEDFDLAFAAFGQEEVAIGRCADKPGIIQ